MKNIKLHIIVLIIVVIAELIGTQTIPLPVGSIVLLPMLFAMIMGLLTTLKPIGISKPKEMKDAGTLVSLTLLLLMAKYGTTLGPNLPQVIKSSPALILQEFGNLGTILLGVPLAISFGLGRQAVGAAHSIAREPNLALIGDRFGLDSEEGKGVLGVYIVGTLFGTILVSLMASIMATVTPLHPYALAMATGVGSASMMTAGVGTLVEIFPAMAQEIQAFGVASNVLSGLDGLYMSIFIGLPLTEWLYRKITKTPKVKKEEGGRK